MSLYLINVALVSCVSPELDLVSGFEKFDVNEKEAANFWANSLSGLTFGLGSTYK
jgi:hypothetical protein